LYWISSDSGYTHGSFSSKVRWPLSQSIFLTPQLPPQISPERSRSNIFGRILILRIRWTNHPAHGFFGEESGDQTSEESWRWIVDPIDGTKAFANGSPTFGTLISLIHNDNPVLGIIDHAALGERWIGLSGQPTTCNGETCKTSQISELQDASVNCTTIDMFDPAGFQLFNQLSSACRYRTFGGDCFSYGLLASGHAHLVCEADLKPYDFMALVPVIEGAGGIITDWEGQRLTPTSGDKVLASANASLHQQAIKILHSQ